MNILAYISLLDRCSSEHQADNVFITPRYSINTVSLLLLFCSFAVAHLQFPGEYPSLFIILSILCFGLGALPISDKNVLYEAIHSLHTFIPLPPYIGKSLHRMLLHLLLMPIQALYSFVFPASPCLVFTLLITSRVRQPQDLVRPNLRLLLDTTLIMPHEHTHSQYGLRLFLWLREITVSRLKVLPVKSISFDISLSFSEIKIPKGPVDLKSSSPFLITIT